MPQPRRSLMAVCLGILSVLGVAPAAAHDLRVMTFNVRLLTAGDGPNQWRYRRDLAAQVIRQQQPDVIGTQELFAEQGDDLIARLPDYAWFGTGRRGGRGDEHMGVFYRRDRLRVVESGDFWLSDTPDVAGSITWGNLLPRMVTWALFERIADRIGDRRRFYLFNTHLPYRMQDEDARVRSVEAIVQRVRALPQDVAVIVVGDFNTGPTGREHALLAADLQDAWIAAPKRKGLAATFHGFTGKANRRIDWIFYRGLQARQVQTITKHEGERYPSDHFPVVATLRWPAQ
ncbi:MAG TPA: endonuclease/exonuclease/phosphatase family protein [Lysobacter sp.]|nr:endonuclease/exonuclease/phosphatase family protein [Lysobacter sp.]